MRLGQIITLAGLLFLLPQNWARGFADERPNFVIMMTDDQRFDAMSCAGHPFLRTPNMDRIAREGVRFRNMFVTNALCAPSRAAPRDSVREHAHTEATHL